MALTAAGLRLAAKAINTDGQDGWGKAEQLTDAETANALMLAFLGNEPHLMRHTAEEPLTYPHPAERDRELLGFAKAYVPADLHPIFDEAIAIPDGQIITDTKGNLITTIP